MLLIVPKFAIAPPWTFVVFWVKVPDMFEMVAFAELWIAPPLTIAEFEVKFADKSLMTDTLLTIAPPESPVVFETKLPEILPILFLLIFVCCKSVKLDVSN